MMGAGSPSIAPCLALAVSAYAVAYSSDPSASTLKASSSSKNIGMRGNSAWQKISKSLQRWRRRWLQGKGSKDEVNFAEGLEGASWGFQEELKAEVEGGNGTDWRLVIQCPESHAPRLMQLTSSLAQPSPASKLAPIETDTDSRRNNNNNSATTTKAPSSSSSSAEGNDKRSRQTCFSIDCATPTLALSIIAQINHLTGGGILSRAVTVKAQGYPSLRLALRSLQSRIYTLRRKQSLRRVEKRRTRARKRKMPTMAQPSSSEPVQVEDELRHLRVGVAACPQGLESAVRKILNQAVPEVTVTNANCSHTISVSRMNGRYYASILPNHQKPAAGDARERGKGDSAPPSRSYYKLREAFARSRLMMDRSDDAYAQAVAVDIGASPGGWTQVLLEKGCRRVYAVDPGVLKLPKPQGRVSHIRGKISRCLGSLKAAMRADNVTGIDILTCDINAHPIQAIQSLLLLQPMLKPKAIIAATLKDFASGPEASKRMKKDNQSTANNATTGFETEVRMWLTRLKRLAHRIEMFHLLTATTWERTVVMELK